MIAFLLTAITALTDPCAPVAPAPRLDPRAAELYSSIGDRELAVPDREAAVYAFRRAMELDGGNDHARLALLSLCRGSVSDDYFQQALRRLDGGDKIGAISLLRDGQHQQPDANAALVEGITLYDLERDAEARPAFERAAQDEALADAARLFLGLIAARAEADRDAHQLLNRAALSNDPHIRETAVTALRTLKRSAWLAVDATLSGGHDTNPALSPSGKPLPGGDWDQFGAAAASVQWSPLGASGPFLLGGGSYRKQLVLAAFDVANLTAGGGWQWRNRNLGLRGQYTFDYFLQGSDSYLRSHRAAAAGWWTTGLFTLSAGYAARNNGFVPGDLQAFSGWRQDGDLSVTADFDNASVSAGYGIARDLTAASVWSFMQHGPQIGAMARVAEHLFVGLDAQLWWREYDDPPWELQRDMGIRAGLAATWWFLDSFGVRGSFNYWRNISNLPDFTSTRLLFSLDLVYALRLRG